MFTHNRSLQTFIDNADALIKNAESPQDLLDLIESARHLSGNFKFNPRDYYLYFSLSCIAFLTGILLFYQTEAGFFFFLTALSVMISIILIIRYRRRQKQPALIADKIFFRDLCFDHHLMNDPSPQFAIQALNARFTDFNRGNHTRNIESAFKGIYADDSKPFSFHYYHFHYVDEHTTETEDSEGKKKSHTVLEHHDRFGFIMPLPDNFQPAKGSFLKIQKGFHGIYHRNKSDYLPASLAFRERFQVNTDSQLLAAKFLKPVIVELLLSIRNNLRELTLEINAHNELLIAFENNHLQQTKRQYDLNDIDAFLAEIKGLTPLPDFEKTCQALAIILRESDNNFH